jgi:hypothetical protein
MNLIDRLYTSVEKSGDKELLDIVGRFSDTNTDNSGQIIIYTGSMFDNKGNIVEFDDTDDIGAD